MPRMVRVLGVVVMVTGVWTAFAPFVGPAIGFAPAGAVAWTWTAPHWQLSLAPGVTAAVAGVTLLAGGAVEAWFAKLMSYAAGLWLLATPVVAAVWLDARDVAMLSAHTTSEAGVVLGFFTVPGVVLVTAAALAAGRRVAPSADGDGVVADGPLPVGEWA
jgi:hypothetical protein